MNDEDTHEDPYEVIRLYEGDGALIVREGGNMTLMGVEHPALRAGFDSETSTQAAPAPLQVRVKELEWWKPDTGDIIADCIVGRYRLGKVAANTNFRLETPSGLLERPTLDYWPEAEAKAAAQADYERRILSALDLSTPTQIAALEAENVKLRAERDFAASSDEAGDEYIAVMRAKNDELKAEVARLTEALELTASEADFNANIIAAVSRRLQDTIPPTVEPSMRQIASRARNTLAALKGSTDAQA